MSAPFRRSQRDPCEKRVEERAVSEPYRRGRFYLSHAAMAVTFVTSLVVLAAMPIRCAGQELTVANVSKAWSDRETRIKSFRFKWDYETQIPALPSAATIERESPALDGVSGLYDDKIEGSGYISSEGQKFRLEFDEPTRTPKLQRATKRRITSVRNGNVTKRLFAGEMAMDSALNPEGFIARPGKTDGGNHIQFYILSLLYRPLSEKIGEPLSLRNAEVLQPRASFENRRCAVIGNVPATGAVTHQIWVDLERDYLPLRVRKYFDGKLILEAKISYSVDRDLTLPESWATTVFRPGTDEVVLSTTAKVVQRELNPVLAPSEFSLEFPVNTRVNDDSGSEPQVYITRDNGEKRIVTLSERKQGIPYDVLLITNQGEGAEGLANPRRWVLILLNAAAFVVLLGLVVRKWFSRRRATG